MSIQNIYLLDFSLKRLIFLTWKGNYLILDEISNNFLCFLRLSVPFKVYAGFLWWCSVRNSPASAVDIHSGSRKIPHATEQRSLCTTTTELHVL